MRPTRWTRKPRATYYGKGGWSIHRSGIGYTNPATGNGVYCDWGNLRHLLPDRAAQERLDADTKADTVR